MKSSMGKNLKAKGNQRTYDLRTLCMNHIYEAKNILREVGVQLPRITIRVTDNSGEGDAIGQAVLLSNCIWISEKALKSYKANLREVVYHEIVHAVTGFAHDDKCPLMSPCINMKPMTKKQADKCLIKYFKLPI